MASYIKVSGVNDRLLEDEEAPASAVNGNAASSESTALMSKPADRTPPERRNFLSLSRFLKLTILVAVTHQNTGYALIRRYSRGHLKETYKRL
jgi:hypothetical protein